MLWIYILLSLSLLCHPPLKPTLELNVVELESRDEGRDASDDGSESVFTSVQFNQWYGHKLEVFRNSE